MKNNRTNRKLKFIRLKNRLRLGFTTFKYYTKISNNISESEEKEVIESLRNDAEESLFKRFRLKNPKKMDIRIGYEGDDFLKNISSLLVELKMI